MVGFGDSLLMRSIVTEEAPVVSMLACRTTYICHASWQTTFQGFEEGPLMQVNISKKVLPGSTSAIGACVHHHCSAEWDLDF